jgi:TRAP-type uncharacterized transport system fused permease subunit
MWLIPIVFVLLLISGTAFAYLMGAVSVLTFVAVDKTQFLSILPQRIFAQLDVFAFMAMPLFILTAEIMSRAGVTRSLIDFAISIVGRFRGGLGHVNILTSVFFAGISGSAIADSAALSRTFVPEMKARGYDPYYAGCYYGGIFDDRTNHPPFNHHDYLWRFDGSVCRGSVYRRRDPWVASCSSANVFKRSNRED